MENLIKVVRKTLADGTVKEYRYARKNPDEPVKVESDQTLEYLIDEYLSSPQFNKRADRTRQDYRKILAFVTSLEKYRNMPLEFLKEEGEAREHFLRLRDQVAARSYRQADYVWVVLNIVLNWGRVHRGSLVKINPCARVGVEKLYDANRKNKVWTDAQITAFKAAASPELTLAITLAFWTAQRQGDLLNLTWDAYDGDVITLTQNKTDVDVVIPVAAPLKALLDATPRKHDRVLVNQDGAPWSADGFRVMWAKTCHKAKVANSRAGGVTFHDLRGTSATRMGQAGCTTIEIASITGHGLESRSARSSLNGYVSLDISLARSTICRFEAYEEAKSQNGNRTGIIDLSRVRAGHFGKKRQ